MEKLLTENELADFLGVSVLTVRRNRSAAPYRLPPHVKFGSSVRYQLRTVLKWLEEHEVGHDSPPKTEPNQSAQHRGRPLKTETVRKSKNAGAN